MTTVPFNTQVKEAAGVYLDSWTLTSANTDGQPISIPGAPDRCFQATGTFGGATIVMQGSLDGGTTWFQLHDGGNTLIALTAADGGAILENALLIRPFLSVAGSGASINVYLLSGVK
jgi:hypothetical protein